MTASADERHRPTIMEHTVFISYSSTDKEVADQICAALEAGGTGCWMAPRDIAPGAGYPAAILEGLQHARVVVVIVTAAAIASPHILTEVGHAFSERKPIIPFRLTATELPPDFDYFLSLSQWLDAESGCTPEIVSRLKEAIAQAEASHPAAALVSRMREQRSVYAGGALALIALATLGYWLWSRGSAATGAREIETKTIASTESSKAPTHDTAPAPWVNPKDGLAYSWIPPGTFTMGCSAGDTECRPDEAPTHPVELPAGFWLGQTEVTNSAYRRVVAGWKFAGEEARLPAVGISWREAKTYCAAIGGRLPTEAEWEYAARGGIAGAYYGVPETIAWYAGNSGGARHEVATRQANAYGLYDTLGNASEWVLDRYYKKYDVEARAIGAVDEPLAGNASAVARGGYWESEAAQIRVSRRVEMDNREPAPMAGIRCVAERK